MFRFPLSVAMGAGVLFANGCSASDAPPKSTETSVPIASPRSATVSDTASSDPNPLTRDNDPVSTFLKLDGIAGDIVAERSLVDFLADNLAVQKDRNLSRPDFGYAVYRDSGRVYEFLDEKLFGVRFVEPHSGRSADNKIAPYLKSLGDPTNMEMPQDLREAKATKFLSWDLPSQKLRINFAYLPTRKENADLELFEQVFNRDMGEEFLTRRSRAASIDTDGKATNRGKSKSVHRQRIEELIAEPEWGKVAATVDRLCAGTLSDEETHIQILKTLNLARGGHFSPKFTLQALQQAEASAVKNQLSPVLAVRTCQQSLAFGAAAADQTPQK
ncbi:MAG: hypothetical protein U0941_29145 [Planctomycetaceae bacterium]